MTGPLRISLLTGFFYGLLALALVTPKSGAWVHLFHRSLLGSDFTAGSPDVLHRVSPPPSGFRPYICKGVHFTDRGESLVATYTESHTV